MILVTGGTGLVGSHLLYRLVTGGEQVRATYRKGSMPEKAERVFSFFTEDSKAFFDKIEWVEADVTDIPQLEKAFKGVTSVYHSAALISFDASDRENMRKVNIEGTANVVNQCILNKVKKLCFVSSIASLGAPQKNGAVTEESYWNPEADNNDYAISKYGAEMEVWRGTREGVPAVIVNPGVILGAGFPDQGSGKLFGMAKKGIRFYTEGQTGFVDVEDVATVMHKLMRSDITNDNFILIADNLPFKKVMTQICTAMHTKPPTRKAGKLVLGMLWRMALLYSKLTGKPPLITKASARAASEKSVYSNLKVKEALSFEFKPVEETIKTVAARF